MGVTFLPSPEFNVITIRRSRLDKRGVRPSRGGMKCFGRSAWIDAAPLKAVLALVFLLMTAIQPGFFAAAGKAGHHQQAAAASQDDADLLEVAAHDHDAAGVVHSSSKSHHHGGAKDAGDKTCEVHCAPGQAVPVEFVTFDHVFARCFGEARVTVLSRGEYAELIRPPRHLS